MAPGSSPKRRGLLCMSGSPHDALDVAIRKARESLDEIERLSGELRRKTQYVGVTLDEAIVSVLDDRKERNPTQIHRAIKAGWWAFCKRFGSQLHVEARA